LIANTFGALMIAILKWRFLNEALLRDLEARQHPKNV